MFRAEYIAGIDAAACSGCRACIERCPFAAIEFNDAENICVIDKKKCYGCGICRASCPADAISLQERKFDPVASNLW